jgi:hypothetical protein
MSCGESEGARERGSEAFGVNDIDIDIIMTRGMPRVYCAAVASDVNN